MEVIVDQNLYGWNRFADTMNFFDLFYFRKISEFCDPDFFTEVMSSFIAQELELNPA